MSRFDAVAPYVILSGAASAAQSKDLEDWFRALALQGMTGFDVDGPYAVVKLQISIVMASQGDYLFFSKPAGICPPVFCVKTASFVILLFP